jgi:flagellar L-ring protein precursor FlgH
VLLLGACAGNRPILPDPYYAPVEPQVVTPAARRTGAIYQAELPVELFQDRRAYRVGDILTVQLSEKTDASTTASTATSKDDSVEIGAPVIFGAGVTRLGKDIFETNFDAQRAFSGNGDTSQSNSLKGDITVSVARVLANGNLVIRGEKVISINQGTEFVRLAGIVRPEDIDAENTVLSNKVANARISYGGRGALADANAQGWLGRFFNGPLWPF